MQVIDEIKNAKFGLFSFQLDESTDISSCSQRLMFVCYIKEGDVKEEFLVCRPLETTTKASDVMNLVSEFFSANGLEWKNACGVCSGGAPAMLGHMSGSKNHVKEKTPEIKGVHCMIHRYALASKTLPNNSNTVMNEVVKMVNHVQSS
jgi:hypothetical protein